MPFKNKRIKNEYFKQRSALVRQRNREYVWEFLQSQCCKVCGESDPIVLDFDHRDPLEKDVSISQAIAVNLYSIKRLQKEMDKCDILCANCHRRKTSKERNFYRSSL